MGKQTVRIIISHKVCSQCIEQKESEQTVEEKALKKYRCCFTGFEGFEKSWCSIEQKRYTEILKQADYIRFISAHY